MAETFSAPRLSPETVTQWLHWLRNIESMPNQEWVSHSGIKIIDPEKYRQALIGDLAGQGAAVRGKGPLRGDFEDFVTAYQTAVWQEEIGEADNVQEVREIIEDIKSKSGNYSQAQLALLRKRLAGRLNELKATINEVKAVA